MAALHPGCKRGFATPPPHRDDCWGGPGAQTLLQQRVRPVERQRLEGADAVPRGGAVGLPGEKEVGGMVDEGDGGAEGRPQGEAHDAAQQPHAGVEGDVLPGNPGRWEFGACRETSFLFYVQSMLEKGFTGYNKQEFHVY